MFENLFDMCVQWWNGQIKSSGMCIDLLSVDEHLESVLAVFEYTVFVSCCCCDVTMSLLNVFLFSNWKLGILWLASP